MLLQLAQQASGKSRNKTSRTRPVPWQTMPGFAAQSKFWLQILNLFVPKDLGSLDLSLIHVDPTDYLEKKSPS